ARAAESVGSRTARSGQIRRAAAEPAECADATRPGAFTAGPAPGGSRAAIPVTGRKAGPDRTGDSEHQRRPAGTGGPEGGPGGRGGAASERPGFLPGTPRGTGRARAERSPPAPRSERQVPCLRYADHRDPPSGDDARRTVTRRVSDRTYG